MKLKKSNIYFSTKFILLLLILLSVPPIFAQNSSDELKPNKSLERQIKGGETHSFQFSIKARQFARVEVVPTNIDVVVSLFDADSKIVVEMDGDSNYLWRESVSAIAEKSGNFKLQIKGKGKPENIGSYTVKIAELRKSVAPDRKRIEAEQTLVQAIKFGQENKPKDSAKLFETSLNLWREVGDNYWEAVTMWNLAWSYFDADRNEEALKLHNQALLIFQEYKDRIGEAGALNGIGAIYRWIKEHQKAREYLETALAIRKELKRLRSEFNSLNSLIAVYSNLNQPDKVLESLNRMLAIAKELKERKDERTALYLSGVFYYSQKSDFTAAQTLLEKALEIDRELKDSAGEIERLKNLGTVYGKLSQFEKAQKTFEQTLEKARKIEDKKSESNVLSELGFFYTLRFNNCDKAREILTQALKIKQELPDKAGEASVLSRLVLSNMCLGDNAKVIEYAEKGIDISKELNDKLGQIGFLQNLGSGYGNIGQVDKAKESYEQALAIAREEKLKFNEITSLLGLANFYQLSQQYEESRKLTEQALSIAEELKNNELINHILGGLGDSYSYLKQYEKSQYYHEQALDVARRENYKDRESNTLRALGQLFLTQKQFEKSQSNFEQALKIAEDHKLTNQIIYILSSFGDLYSNQNQLEQAINYYEKSLNLARESKHLDWQTTKLFSLGNTYIRLNQYEKAKSYFEESLAKAKDSKNYVYQAIALISLGDMYFKLNQYEKARDYFEQVEKIAKDKKNRWLLGFATGGIGSVYTDLSSNEKAQSNFEQSLSLLKEVLDRSGEGNVLTSLGRTYLNLKDYDKAQKYFEESLAIAKEVKNKQGEVYPLINLGAVFQNKNQLAKAQDFYEQGLSLAKEVKDRGNEGYALNGLGEVFFKLKNYKQAEDFYRQSLVIAKEVQSKKLKGSVSHNLMEFSKELKKPQVAIVYGKQAINIFQEIRGNIKGFEKDSQQSYLKDKESAYRTLADILISQERFPEAQAVLNLLKEEEYSQLARTGEKGETIPYSDIEAVLLERSEKLPELQRQRDELLKIENPTDEQKQQAEKLRLEIIEANKSFNNALNELAKAENSVSEQVGEFQRNKNLKGALTSLRQRTNSGVVALYTLIGREETTEKKNPKDEKTKFGWIILVTEKGHKAYPIDVTNFNETVFQFRDALSSDNYDPRPLAQKIYNAVFRQKSAKQKRTLEQDLQEYLGSYQNKALMWSLDGVLRYVPMAALHDGKNYLAEKYLNAVFTEESIISLQAENNPNWKILGLGVSEQREGFEALPGVKIELETIVREENPAIGILSGTIKLNDNFKKELFFTTISKGDYPVIHIASHYSFKPTQQKESFLLVGNGRLTFGELEGENLFGGVDLLTLSACETGVSGNGKEAEGFPIKAQELGAKSVIASLWNVSDKGTPELMIQFYKLRAANSQMSKGEAFRQAQLSLLYGNTKVKKTEVDKISRAEIVGGNSGKLNLPLFVKDAQNPFAHPHYWSSFVLIGNWR